MDERERRGLDTLESARMLWRASPDEPARSTGGIDEEQERMMKTIKDRAARFERTIRRRDLIEAAAGLFAVLVTLWASIQAPGWIPKLGALAVAISVAWVLHRMISVRRRTAEVDPGMTIAAALRVELARVDDQIRLLSTVARWYVLPLALGSTVWVTSFAFAAPIPPERRLAGALFLAGSSLVIFALIGAGVVWINRAAVRQRLEPLRAEIVSSLGEGA